jgi:hypothetical protein
MTSAAAARDLSSIRALRALLDERFPDASPITRRATQQLATGIGELDRALPSGGLPRGRLSVWRPAGGATAILRAACQGVLAAGERSAWIDAVGTVAGAFWDDGPLLVRPSSRLNALRSAEELLRSGGFALVVLAGAEPRGQETVRLTRATRDGGSALVALTAHAAMSALKLTSRITPADYRYKRTPFGDPAEITHAHVRVDSVALGWKAHAEFVLPVTHHELRLSLEPELADRRGVAR